MATRARVTVRYPMTAAAKPPKPPKVSLRKHNAILDAAQDRVDKLEPRLAAVIETILHKAGTRAASRFHERVTRHSVPDPTLVAAAANADVAKTSTMIALKPRPDEAAALAHEGGDPPEILHVTLAYLGNGDQPLSEIADALRPVAATHGRLSGVVGGLGVFHPAGVGIALPDVRGLAEVRQAVVHALQENGIDYGRDHGFTAHITIQGDGEPPDDSVAGQPLHFDALHIVRGNDEEIELPLVGVRSLTAAGPDWSPPFADELIDVDALIRQILEKTEPVRAALIEETMTPLLKEAGLSFDVSNPLTAKLFAETASQVTNIAMTTRANLMDIIGKSYQNGLTIPATRDLIRQGMRAASKTRATMIARTEMARAVNGGSLAATQLVAQETGQAYNKVWHTAPGAKYPRHELYEGLDGQTVGMNEEFEVGDDQLQFPGDPNGEPGETINCRCTLSYVEAEKAAGALAGIEKGVGNLADDIAGVIPTIESDLKKLITDQTGAVKLPKVNIHVPKPDVVTDSVEEAAKALAEGKRVELTQVSDVNTFIDDLGKMAAEAKAAGEKAPNLDLAKVSIKGTNLFTQESLGIPRVDMPQLTGLPIPGSPAEKLPTTMFEGKPSPWRDIGPSFFQSLRDQGIKVTEEQVNPEALRATQDELNGPKIAKLMDEMEEAAPHATPPPIDFADATPEQRSQVEQAVDQAYARLDRAGITQDWSGTLSEADQIKLGYPHGITRPPAQIKVVHSKGFLAQHVTDSNIIEINVDSPDFSEKAFAKQAAIIAKGEVPEFLTSDAADAIIHEYGHVTFDYMDIEGRAAWRSQWNAAKKKAADDVLHDRPQTSLPSTYAADHPQEAWAETFTALVNKYPQGAELQAYMRPILKEEGILGEPAAAVPTPGSPIIISSDNYILDGHHRWAAAVGRDYLTGVDVPTPVSVERIDEPITTLLQQARDYSKEMGIPPQSAFEATKTAVTPPVPAEAVAPATGTTQSIDIGITPFRAATDKAVGFYDSAKYRQFINDVNQSAEAYGVHIDSIEKMTGVWEGDTEPSVSIHVSPVAETAAPAPVTLPEAFTRPLEPLVGDTAQALADSLHHRAEALEPALTVAMRNVAAKNGGDLAGLDFRLKTVKSTTDKIANDAEKKGISLTESAAQIGDEVRYTVLFDPANYVSGTKGVLDDLASQGFEIRRFRNTWASGGNYKGINVQLVTKNGYKWELQFHTPDSYALKSDTGPNHALYKKWQKLDATDPKAIELDREMMANADAVANPPGVADFAAYTPPREETTAGLPSEVYKAQHSAPGPDYGAPMYDLTGGPEKVEAPPPPKPGTVFHETNMTDDVKTLYAEQNLDTKTLIKAANDAVKEDPMRLVHGNTGETGFFISDGKVFAWKDYNKMTAVEKSHAVPVHSHSGVNYFDDPKQMADYHEPWSQADIHQWFAGLKKDGQGGRQMLLYADGKADILGIGPTTDPAVIKMGPKTLDKSLREVGYDPHAGSDANREAFHRWYDKHGLTYQEVQFAKPNDLVDLAAKDKRLDPEAAKLRLSEPKGGGGIYPDDVYDQKTQVHVYGQGGGPEDRAMDQATFNTINAVRGDPNAIVTVYRGVPGDVTTINPGDWVTPSKTYAEHHAEANLGADAHGHVISMQVPAGQLWTDGNSIQEWGWNPPNFEQFNAEARARAFAANLGKAYNQDGVLLFEPGTEGVVAPVVTPAWPLPPVEAVGDVTKAQVTKASDIVKTATDRLDAAGISPDYNLGLHPDIPFAGIDRVTVEHLGADQPGALTAGDHITINVDHPDFAKGARAATYKRDAESLAKGETPVYNQTDPGDLLLHEYGHVIYQSLTAAQRDEWTALWEKIGKEDIGVSKLPSFYAQEAKQDAWSETFVGLVRSRTPSVWQDLMRKVLTENKVLVEAQPSATGESIMATFQDALPEKTYTDAMAKVGISGGRFTPDGRLQVIGSGEDFVKQLKALAEELDGVKPGTLEDIGKPLVGRLNLVSSQNPNVAFLRKATDSEDLRVLWSSEGTAGIADQYDLDTVTNQMQSAAQDYVYKQTQESLERRGLPDEITVWRKGNIEPGDIESFSLYPNQGVFKDQVPYVVKRKDILVDTNSFFPDKYADEHEVMVLGADAKPIEMTGKYDVARGTFSMMERDEGDYQKALDAFSHPKGVTALNVPKADAAPPADLPQGEPILNYPKSGFGEDLERIAEINDDFLAAPQKEWISHVNEDEDLALGVDMHKVNNSMEGLIYEYTEDGSRDINGILSGDLTAANFDEHAQQYLNYQEASSAAKAMTQIVDSAPPLPEGTTLYRGINVLGVNPDLLDEGNKAADKIAAVFRKKWGLDKMAYQYDRLGQPSPEMQKLLDNPEFVKDREEASKATYDAITKTIGNWAAKEYPVGSYVAMGEPGEFESLTLNPNLAVRFGAGGNPNAPGLVFKVVNAKTGAPIFPFSAFTDESEILAPPNTMYRVRSVEKVKMDVIGDSPLGKEADKVVVTLEEAPKCGPVTAALMAATGVACTNVAKYVPAEPKPTVGNAELFPGQPRDVAEAAAAHRERKIAEYAKANGMTVADYKHAAEQAIRSFVAEHPQIRIRLTHQTLEEIIQDGRFKNEFEIPGVTPEMTQGRIDAEHNLFGLPADAAPRDRPIYGYLAGTADEAGEVQEYGDIIVNLDPSVNARATFTIGDSYTASINQTLSPSLLGDPGIGSWDGSFDIVKAYREGNIEAITRYVEVEIHGGLPLSDVGSIAADRDLIVARETAERTKEAIEAITEIYANSKGTQQVSPQVEEAGVPTEKPEQLDYATALRDLGKNAGLRQGALSDLMARVGLRGFVASDFEDFNVVRALGAGIL